MNDPKVDMTGLPPIPDECKDGTIWLWARAQDGDWQPYDHRWIKVNPSEVGCPRNILLRPHAPPATHAKCPKHPDEWPDIVRAGDCFYVECSRDDCWSGPICETEAEAWEAWDAAFGKPTIADLIREANADMTPEMKAHIYGKPLQPMTEGQFDERVEAANDAARQKSQQETLRPKPALDVKAAAIRSRPAVAVRGAAHGREHFCEDTMMTDAQVMERAAYLMKAVVEVNAAVARAMCKLEGMKAENAVCAIMDETPIYKDKDFAAIIDAEALGYNNVVMLLNSRRRDE